MWEESWVQRSPRSGRRGWLPKIQQCKGRRTNHVGVSVGIALQTSTCLSVLDFTGGNKLAAGHGVLLSTLGVVYHSMASSQLGGVYGNLPYSIRNPRTRPAASAAREE